MTFKDRLNHRHCNAVFSEGIANCAEPVRDAARTQHPKGMKHHDTTSKTDRCNVWGYRL